MTDKRQERMLEEVLKLSGNNCRALAPRWASINLGIFLCVSCASIHRKMGTHTSRVKSVTLDTWTREQIVNMRNIGNTASNAKYCPDERAHPPPTNVHSDERDSEMEKYIRRKYEQKSFMPGARGGPAPTSLNRTRERQAPGSGLSPWVGRDNKRNPELNDIVVPAPSVVKEKALPGLPESRRGSTGPLAPPRPRPSPTPSRSSSIQNLAATGGVATSAAMTQPLIDINGASSSTLPLQLGSPGHAQFQAGYSMGTSPQPTQLGMSAFGTSPTPMYANTRGLAPTQIPSNGYFPQQSGSFQQPPMLSIPTPMGQPFNTSPGGYGMQSLNPFATSPGGMIAQSPNGMQMGMNMGMGQAPMQMGMQHHQQMQNQAQAPWSMQGAQMQGMTMNGGWQGYQYHG